jgi:glycosyltransferase involved in cell wall biosynthesis
MTEGQSRIVIATILPERGPTGVQSHCRELRMHLEDRRLPVAVVTPFREAKALVYPLFAVRRLLDPISSASSVWWYRHWHAALLRRALESELSKPGSVVVYAQCPLAAWAALKARSSVRQRIVMIVHFNVSQADEWCDKGKISRNGLLARRILTLEADVLPLLDGIVYVSRYMKECLEARIPRLRRVPNAIIPNFCSGGATKSEVAAPVDIINVGTLEPRKNQRFLLEIVANARDRGKRYTLALVGDGPDRAALERQTRELGIEGQVRFFGNRPNAVGLMAGARLYAHAATLENLPLAIIEAMACGLPILAPAVGGISELIDDGKEGAFWTLADTAGSADLLIQIMESPTVRQRMAAAASERFHSQFATALVADRLRSFLLGDGSGYPAVR